jgi:hypothetical protein
MMNYLGNIGVILFSLKPQFRGQKEWFKMILGPAYASFVVIMIGYRGQTPSAKRNKSFP